MRTQYPRPCSLRRTRLLTLGFQTPSHSERTKATVWLRVCGAAGAAVPRLLMSSRTPLGFQLEGSPQGNGLDVHLGFINSSEEHENRIKWGRLRNTQGYSLGEVPRAQGSGHML